MERMAVGGGEGGGVDTLKRRAILGLTQKVMSVLLGYKSTFWGLLIAGSIVDWVM